MSRPIKAIIDNGVVTHNVAVSLDGRWLAVSNDEATAGARADAQLHEYVVRVGEIASGREVAHFSQKTRSMDSMSFSRDSRWLAFAENSDVNIGDVESSVCVRDLADQVPGRSFIGHRSSVTAVVFSPDDRWLASAGTDATVLIWNAEEFLRTSLVARGDAVDLERSWSNLASDDAPRAYQTIWALAAVPERTIPFLAKRLKRVEADDPNKNMSLGSIASGETLRRLRAIAVLEIAGTHEARRLLEKMASGHEGARATREARTSLRRMERK